MGTNERDEERGGGTETSGIKVTDRRLFTSEGNLRPEVSEVKTDPEAPREPVESGREARRESPGSERGFERRPLEEPPAVDFTMLINAMAQPALIYLGEIPHPGTGRPELDLEQARLQIDLLDILRIKCRGNLSEDEQGLLDRILYHLRMLFVNRSAQPGS